MANYTIELRKIHESPNTHVFNFNYDFYIDNQDIKNKFQEKFIDHYYFDEIGFETVGRFQHRLRTRLNEIMPYYKQLYKTELESQNINFLLNKDLRETTTRNLNKEDNATNTNTSSSNNESTTTANENNLFKESTLNNGNASLNLEGSLTSTNSNNSSLTNNATNHSNGESSLKSSATGNEAESITFLSQGNIGITSSAELLEKWRSVLINIDQMIIDECKDLFMKIY